MDIDMENEFDPGMGVDFLEMFDECLGLDADASADSLALPEHVGSELAQVSSPQVPVQVTGSNALVEVPPEVFQHTLPTHNSKKTKLDWRVCPKALSWYRHFCKAKKKIRTDESTVLDALIALQKKHKTGKHCVAYNVKRVKRRNRSSEISKRSLVLQAKMKIGKGNRYSRQFSMTDFLEVAFGEKDAKNHFRLVGHIATHFNMSRETVQLMRTTVAASVMTKQIQVAARVFALCKSNPPVTVAVRHAWDETAQDINVNLLGGAASRSAWKVMVQKVSIMIFWNQTSLSMDLVS
jgi:hypothetical protein